MNDLFSSSDAIVSECGRFRYALTRRWGDGPTALFLMLNPSTADASEDDPTIRRCIGFAKREGCGALRVENLYAFRATEPTKMFEHAATAIGATDTFIREAVQSVDGPIIAAWGADKRSEARAQSVMAMLNDMGVEVLCLGKTQSGQPRHPLYLKSDAPLVSLSQ